MPIGSELRATQAFYPESLRGSSSVWRRGGGVRVTSAQGIAVLRVKGVRDGVGFLVEW